MELSASNSSCLNDETLGPVVVGCRDDFDFTVTFEESFLSIAPSAAFAVLAVLRLAYLGRKPQLLRGRSFQILKLGAISVYTGLQVTVLALLGSAASEASPPNELSIVAASLSLFDSLLFFGLSAWEHSRSKRSSVLFNVYLLLTLLFDATRIRTSWLEQPDSAVARIFTTALAVKVVILVLESQGKQKWLPPQDRSPEETGGIFTLSFFSWLNHLIVRGYRKVLVQSDLHAFDHTLSAEAHQETFRQYWQTSTPGKHRLLRALARGLKWRILLPVLPRILNGAFSFAQPFLVNAILAYLQKDSGSTSPNSGYGLIGASALVYTGIAVSNGIHQYLHQRALTALRACLVTVIYDTTLSGAASHSNDNSAAVTLMSADVNRIQAGFDGLHECWANAVEIAIAAWLLQRQLGAAFTAPIVVVLVCGAGSFIIGKFLGKYMGIWMSSVQKRVGLTANVINNITPVKMLGLQEAVTDRLQSFREDEMKAARQFRWLTTIATMLGYTPQLLTPAVTFAVTNQELTITRVFTSLAYLQLLSSPLAALFQMIPQIMVAFPCLNRVQKYLETNFRSNTSDYRQLSKASPNVVNSSSTATSTIQIVQDGNFGWDDSKVVLHDVNISIPAKKLTIVAGPVASGKSTLCMGILNELPHVTGNVISLNHFSQVAFCHQTAFLTNSTVRENITGHATFDRPWYEEVVEATALREDLESFPEGDQSLVGSNGIILSGGQKQRVSLARAMYARPQLAIFDDVLSGLDPATEKHVFDRVFASGGLLDKLGTTALLCTHSIGHLRKAAHVVVLGNGSTIKQGPPEAIITDDFVASTITRKAPQDSSGNASDSANPKSPTTKLAKEEEDRARQTGDFRVYAYYFSCLGSTKVIPAIVAFFFSSAAAVGFFFNFGPVWLEFWAASVQKGEDRYVFYAGIFITLQVVCISFLGIFFGFSSIFMTLRASLHIHWLALVALMNAPLTYFSSVDVGAITSYFSQDMSIVDDDFAGQLSNTVATGLVVIGQGAVIAASSPFVLIGYPALALLLWVVQRVYLRTSRQLRLLELETNGPLQSHFLETLTGLATIRAFGWSTQSSKIHSHLLDASQQPRYLLTMLQKWLGMVLKMTVAVLAVIFVTLATQLHNSSPGLTGVGLVSLMTFGEMLGSIVRCYTHLETATGALNRLKSLIETVPDSNLDLESREERMPSAAWPEKGQVEIKNVSAAYSGTEMETATPEDQEGKGFQNGRGQNFALRDISLAVTPGEKLAICGRTGSGKSSLMLLLLRFLTPIAKAGDITIDGLPLKSIKVSALRSRIITLPQAPFLLPEGSSVRSNMAINDSYIGKTYDPSVVDEECHYALSAVGLWPFVEEKGGLGSGLDPEILSKGQKQLFCLARAILRARIRFLDYKATRYESQLQESETHSLGGLLLLDEFTASVDVETDKLMQSIIRKEFASYTVICVTHRLHTVMDYNRVVVMDGGRIVEVGSPDDIIGRDQGVIGREVTEFS